MRRKLFVHATNVHQGGGRALLGAILNALPAGVQSILSLDSRMPFDKSSAPEVLLKVVPPSVAQRLMAERWLASNVQSDDTVLCFGNLPPLFKLRGHVVVFLQNRYLIDTVNQSGLPFRVRCRIAVERLWLTSMLKNVDEFVVQTPSMKRLLEARTKSAAPIHVQPFMASHQGYARRVQLTQASHEKDCDFVYVASGEPHKSHRELIDAWALLAEEGLFPSLRLTLDRERFAELCRWIDDKVARYGMQVVNMGEVPPGQVGQLYRRAGAVIYPSTFESFGLPLIEARHAGLPVLASELDYVRDVLDPEQSFDPQSPVSIARAVRRFMNIEENILPLQNAKEFVTDILERARLSAHPDR